MDTAVLPTGCPGKLERPPSGSTPPEPIVTVAILTHNARLYLDRTIPAILSWVRSCHEVLVFDNGSSDGTVEELKQWGRLRVVVNGTNSGYARGKNALVDLARGEYVLLLDDDILVSNQDVVSECLAFVAQRPNVAFVSVPLVNEGQARTPHYGLYFTQIKRQRSLSELQRRSCFQAGGFVGGLTFFRRRVFQRLGGYDTLYPCEDYDLCARTHLQGWQIYTITSAHALHLGASRRADIDRWIGWHRYYLCGFLRNIVKNYTAPGVFIWVPLASLWILWITLRKFWQTGHPGVLHAYVTSARYFARDVRGSLRQRSRIQAARLTSRDEFRRIRYSDAPR